MEGKPRQRFKRSVGADGAFDALDQFMLAGLRSGNRRRRLRDTA